MKTMICALAVALAGLAQPAHALNTRTWVASTGTDNGSCGPILTPCRTLQYAHDQTSPGGEINFKDAAGYGAVIITKAINVINEGGIAGVLAIAGGNAITINAGANDAVVLRGLTVEGAKVAANGIVFNSGGELTIVNCVVQGFAGTGNAGNGIYIKHAAGTPNISIAGTTSSYNQWIGIVYTPSGTGGGRINVSGTTVSHNGYGLSFYSGDTTATHINAVAYNSEALNNTSFGFQFFGNMEATLAHSAATNNGATGIIVANGPFIVFSHNTAINNATHDLDVIETTATTILYTDKTSIIRFANLGSNNLTIPPF